MNAIVALLAEVPRDALKVPRLSATSSGCELVRYSILGKGLQTTFNAFADSQSFQAAREQTLRTVVDACTDDSVSRAVGALVGMAIGDGVGAPLEFLATTSEPISDRRPHLQLSLSASENLVYLGEFNKFGLHRGQWTDDASMGLCLADSLLCRSGYDGSDCRVRYNMWWQQGYNNAFRFDPQPKHSCGLGGNIANSIEEVNDFQGQSASRVPPRFTASGEDAGNGSIMRLAAVPIRYHANSDEAAAVARESSFATHPGPDAAACCEFMAFAISDAIRHVDSADAASVWLNKTIVKFMQQPNHGTDSTDTGLAKLACVLTCTPPSDKEAVWNWKETRLAVEPTIRARAPRYNGYPVSPGYFGSYCMDGLAMSLWAFNGSSSFVDCILRVVNLLGDCDTTGAIAGQFAGAFYGYNRFSDGVHGAMGAVMLENLYRWDPLHEIPLRAAMLYKAGSSTA